MKLVLPTYPCYQDTGLPWASRVPAHWEMERGKWLFRKLSLPVSASDDVVTCFRDGTVTLRKNRRTSGFTESIKEIGYQGIRQGNLVIHAMDAFAGAIGVSDSDGKCTPIYAVCEPLRPLNVPYYAQLIREMSRNDYIIALSRGIRERSTDFRYEMFGMQRFPVPPIEEQDAIGRFIWYTDQRVNRLLKTKRRLIELLNEQKQAIIHRAVTRGLDPAVPLKSSEVEWLGDVPAHWEVKRLKYVAPEMSVKLSQKPVDLPYIGLENIEPRTGRLLLDQPMEVVDSVVNKFERGDILFGKLRPYLAKVVQVSFTGVCTTEALVLRPTSDMSRQFLFYLLLSNNFISEVNTGTYGSRMPRASSEQIGSISIAYPKLSEQQEIANYLIHEAAQFEEIISRIEREIAFIREYRTRLVSDVVTGQLDVRGLTLPEMNEEPVAPEDADEEMEEEGTDEAE